MLKFLWYKVFTQKDFGIWLIDSKLGGGGGGFLRLIFQIVVCDALYINM